MVNKSSYMIAFFAMIFLAVSLASASNLNLTLSKINTPNIVQGSSASIAVILVNNNNSINITDISFSGASGSLSNLINGSSQTLNITIPISSDESLGSKTYSFSASGKINGTDITSDSVSVTLNITQSDQNKIFSEICEVITTNITGVDRFDSDDLEDWHPFDKISLTLENIKNNMDDRDSFDISLLFYKGTEDRTSDIATDKSDLKRKDLKIDEKDSDDSDFDFTISSDADEGKYDVYAKIVGDDAGCYVEYVGTANILKEEDDYSIVSNVNGPSSSSCGENVDLAVTVSNIGDRKADKVKVVLYNKELGINMFREIEDLNDGEEDLAYFTFVAPQNAVERSYKFNLYTEFDYDDDDEEYGEYSDDEYDYTYTLSLSGNCIDPTKPTLSAKLNSSAVVGEELIVAVTFKNNGNVSTSAIIAPEDFESWAELLSEPETITVGRSESKTVYITFKPIKAGQQTFNINAIYNGKSVDQPVTVSIEANPSVISSLKEKFGVTGAYLVLGIAILVFLIILVLIVKFIFWLFRKH